MVERRVGEGAVELIEAALGRAKLLVEAEVPLADDAGRVAEPFEDIRDGAFRERQAELGPLAVELMPVARLISARHQAGPRRTAVRPGDIALREADAVPGDRVDVRRRDVLAALEAVLPVA